MTGSFGSSCLIAGPLSPALPHYNQYSRPLTFVTFNLAQKCSPETKPSVTFVTKDKILQFPDNQSFTILLSDPSIKTVSNPNFFNPSCTSAQLIKSRHSKPVR